jgi:hypothetical protein
MSDAQVRDDYVHKVFGVDPRAQQAQATSASTSASDPLKGPISNPFDAPEARVEIEKCAMPVVQQLAVEQAQNAARDFQTAVGNVKTAQKAKSDAAKAEKAAMYTLAVSIALMPLGPVTEAASVAIAGPALQSKLMEALVNNAGRLEAKFGKLGAGAANKTFDFVASDAVGRLAAVFDPGKAKAALGLGISSLQGKTVSFLAGPDPGTCVANYLDAIGKAANDAMHNLTDLILKTQCYSEALAYYNFFSKPLQGIYEAVLGQQAQDMLTEVADVIATNAETGVTGAVDKVLSQDEVGKFNAYGRPLFAHLKRYAKPDDTADYYEFLKWVTPDMEPLAAKVAKDIDTAYITNRIPPPDREPGERVILVDGWGKERVMLIEVEDQGIFWKEYGVPTFKRWAEPGEDDKALRSRAAMQHGGLEKLDLAQVKKVQAPTN